MDENKPWVFRDLDKRKQSGDENLKKGMYSDIVHPSRKRIRALVRKRYHGKVFRNFYFRMRAFMRSYAYHFLEYPIPIEYTHFIIVPTVYEVSVGESYTRWDGEECFSDHFEQGYVLGFKPRITAKGIPPILHINLGWRFRLQLKKWATAKRDPTKFYGIKSKKKYRQQQDL